MRFAGKITGWKADAGEKYLEVKVGGTQHEGLLRYLSGRLDKLVQVHMCPDPCKNRVWKDGLVHLEKMRRAPEPEEAWMSNAVEVERAPGDAEVDELRRMREEAQQVAPPEVRGRSPNRRKSRSAEKRIRKKRRRSSEEEVRKEKESRAQKEVEALFSGTGLDPDPVVRRKQLRRGQRLADKRSKKKKKKSRKSSHRGSGGSSSSSDSRTSGQERGESRTSLFTETSTVKKLAMELPGVLAANWLEDCRTYLLDAQGMVWAKGEGAVQPLAVQFFRAQMMSRLSGPMGREYLTLMYVMDLLAQGRPAQAMDVACQRAKSLASTASGIHYSISQQMEVIPVDRTLPASLSETWEASKAVREEEKIYAQAKNQREWKTSQGKEGGAKDGKGRDGKGKKGKAKEGKGKDDRKGQGADSKRS